MQELKLNIRICSLEEYMELTGIENCEQLLQEFGVVAKEYAYCKKVHSTYNERCFAPVIAGNYKEAIQRAIDCIME